MTKHKTQKNAKGVPVRGILIIESPIALHEDGKVNMGHWESVKKHFASHPTLNDDYHVVVSPMIGIKETNYVVHNVAHTPTAKIEELQKQIDEALADMSALYERVVAQVIAELAQGVEDFQRKASERIERIDGMKIQAGGKSEDTE